MDGIIQLVIGAAVLWLAFGVLKGVAKAAFFVVTAIAVLILLWGAFDMLVGVVEGAGSTLMLMSDFS